MSNIQKSLNDSFLKENEYIFKKYKPIKKIGQGNFGNIYYTIRLKDKNAYALKTEKINSKYKTLESEAYFLFILQGFGIPKLISYGHTKKYNILIETLLDKSLHNIFIRYKKKCSIEDIYLIAMQLLDRLEWIHSKNIVYRDVKPENFLIGIDDPNVIYVVDFGLCKKYRSSKTGKHLLPKLTGKFTGTLAYASPNVIRGKESSRRDDLISLAYVLIKLLKGYLPWPSDLKGENKNKYYELLYLKETDGCGKLFEDIPQEFIDYVKYCKKLKFEEEPNYSYLRSLFIKIINKRNLNPKIITFSFIDSKNKNFLGLPRNNSTRKVSPQSRILKTIIEQRIKRIKSETFSPMNLNNNSNIISLTKSQNFQTTSTIDKFNGNYFFGKAKFNNSKSLNIIKSKFNLKNSEKKSMKKIIYKRKINSSINDNSNDKVKSPEINKSFAFNQNQNNINNIIFNNQNKSKNIFFKINGIKREISPSFKLNKSINNSKINNSSHFLSIKNLKKIKNIKQKKNILYKNIISKPIKIKKQLNLSNNTEYKSKFLTINNSKINLKPSNNFKLIKNKESPKLDLLKIKKSRINKMNNDIIPCKNKHKNLNIKMIIKNNKTVFYRNNFPKNLNLILINNNIGFVNKDKFAI